MSLLTVLDKAKKADWPSLLLRAAVAETPWVTGVSILLEPFMSDEKTLAGSNISGQQKHDSALFNIYGVFDPSTYQCAGNGFSGVIDAGVGQYRINLLSAVNRPYLVFPRGNGVVVSVVNQDSRGFDLSVFKLDGITPRDSEVLFFCIIK